MDWGLSLTDVVVKPLVGTAPEPFQEVFAYWDELRDGAWAPLAGDFFIDALPPPIIPWSVLIDVDPSGQTYIYRFWGTQRVRLIGAEMTGKSVADIGDRTMREGNVAEYDRIARERKPMLFETPVTTKSGSILSFESIRLPLRDADDGLTRIYSAMNHLAVTRRHYEHYGTQVPGRTHSAR